MPNFANFLTNILNRVAAKITSRDYQEYYLKVTKKDENWKNLIGPVEAFEKVRDWQFEKLLEHGLEPKDKLLDVGCGVLRGGIPFIRYLNKGNYYGMDISPKVLKIARERIRKNNLEDKNPTVFRNKNLKFNDSKLRKVEFEYILAQSVFTHLPPEDIEECLSNLDKVLSSGGKLLAAFNRNHKFSGSGGLLSRRTNFQYPLRYFKNLGDRYGLEVNQVFSGQPNGQELLKISFEEEGGKSEG